MLPPASTLNAPFYSFQTYRSAARFYRGPVSLPYRNLALSGVHALHNIIQYP